ncbi:MAG: SpoVA/SpoVAEb family sporulation membrane protein [Erysipelotrichaceae bacterium]
MIYLYGFLFCGTICLIAQLLYEHTKLTPGHITSIFVIIGSLLNYNSIYDFLITKCGAGALIPITSFGHSLTHGAIEASKSLGLIGIPLGIFNLTASGISSAIFFAFIMALIFKAKS